MKLSGVAAIAAMAVALVLSVGLAPTASAGANVIRTGSFWADGVLWGSAVTPALLPSVAPDSSFDKFFLVLRPGVVGPIQVPVGEAGPGNIDYNGGRWVTYTATWTEKGIADHGGNPPVLTSYADVMFHWSIDHLTLAQGSIPGGPPAYFECPLLPVSA